MSHSEVVSVAAGEHEVHVAWSPLDNQPEQRVKLLHRQPGATDWRCMRTFTQGEVVRLPFEAGEVRLRYLPTDLAQRVAATIAPIKPKPADAPEEFVEHTLH